MEDYYMQRAEDDYIEQADIDSTMIVNEVAEQVVADDYVDDREQQVMAMDANRVYQGADDVAREDYLEEQVVGMDTGGYNQFVQRDDGFVDAGYPSVAEDIAVDAVANDFAQINMEEIKCLWMEGIRLVFSKEWKIKSLMIKYTKKKPCKTKLYKINT
jgi:hypothetical protein